MAVVVFYCQRVHTVGHGGGPKGAGRPGKRETCGHHGLCVGMEGKEPCPSSSSTTTKTVSLTLSKPNGYREERFYSNG